MKWIYIMHIILFSIPLFGQNTFTKIYDSDNDALRNHLNDFEVIENNIYTFSTLFCDLDNNIDATCVALTKYNMDGVIIEEVILDSLNASEYCYEGICCLKDTIVISTYVKGEKFEKVTLIQFDENFNQLNINKYSDQNTPSYLKITGVEYLMDDLYYFGTIHNYADIPDSAQIIKTDIQGNELSRFYFSYGNSSLDINNVQSTQDGNLAFILDIDPPIGANNGFRGYQLMKIDTSGQVLDTFSFEDNGQQPNRLLSASDGSFYFSSLEHPFEGWNPLSYGMINKMDVNMDTLEWSLILPNNQLVDGRHYRIWDYIEAANGDIVACGMAYDNTDTELSTGFPDKNSTWNGFITRITPEGDINWLRLYKNNNDLLPHDEYGRFRPSRLNKIKELPDGRFIVAGDVFVKNSQLAAINEQETEAFHLWLLMVDANGCLEGNDCEEIIRINPKREIRYSIGDEWTYEQEDFLGGGNTNIDFKAYVIEDTIFDGIRTKYIVNVQDTFYVENGKMFFWDEYYQEYIMYFDFKERESYDIKYYDEILGVEEIATVVIDSVTYQIFGKDSLQMQHVHIMNSGTLEDYTDIVYEGVGAGYFGIKFLLGCGLCDNNPYITKLRCFTNDTMTFQFVPYACDSTWLTTSIHEHDKELLKLYPNPTTQKVYIDGINEEVDYKLYSSNGQIIKEGTTVNMAFDIENTGFYILKFKVGGKWRVKRVAKIE